MLCYARSDFGAYARLPPALLDGHHAAGLLHRFDDGRGVHGFERAQVDDLGADPVLGEFVGRLERIGHAHRPGYDGDVGAGARDPGFAERHDVVIELRYWKALAIE